MYLSSIINPVIPVIFLFAMNTIIIRAVAKSRELRRCKTESSSEKQITIMLILVSVTFVLLMLPFEIRDNYYYFAGRSHSPKDFAVFYFLFLITRELFTLNFGINFFLYLLSGTKFRRDLRKLFCGRNDRNSTASMSISGSYEGNSCVSNGTVDSESKLSSGVQSSCDKF